MNIMKIKKYASFFFVNIAIILYGIDNITDTIPKEIAVIGGGFSGMMSALILAKQGFAVTIYEQNDHLGGRLFPIVNNYNDFIDEDNNISISNSTTDYFKEPDFKPNNIMIGPSWYWMDEIIESTLNNVGNYTIYSYVYLNKNPVNYRVFVDTYHSDDTYHSYDKPFLNKGYRDISNANFFDNIVYKNDQIILTQCMFDHWLKNDYSSLKSFLYETNLFCNVENSSKTSGLSEKMFTSYGKYLDNYFVNLDDEAKALMKWPYIFLGLNPNKDSSIFSFIPFISLLVSFLI